MNKRTPDVKRKAYYYIGALIVSTCLAASALASPSLTVTSASGQAGTTVALPVNFNPDISSIASLQFNLVLPAGLSTGTVTAGAILNNASKSVSTNLSGSTWTFIIFGLNQSAISAGTLVTAQLGIAAGAPAGTLSVGISGIVYSDSNGKPVAGTGTRGAVTVTSAPPSPPSITQQPANATVTAGQSATFSVTATGSSPLTYQWQKNGTNIAGATSASYTTPATAAADNGATFVCVIANSAGTATSNAATLTVNAASVTLSAIVLSPASAVKVGRTVQLTAKAYDQSGNVLSGVVFSFNSSNPSVASVNGSGLVTGLAPGQTIITASAGSVSSNGDYVTVLKKGKRVHLLSLSNSGSMMSDSDTNGEGDARALVLSHRNLNSQSLVFDPEIQEAKLIDMQGHTLAAQSQSGGTSMVMMLENAGDGRLAMESGLLLIQMKDDTGHVSVRPLIVMK